METFVCDQNQLIDPKQQNSENYFQLMMLGKYLQVQQATLILKEIPYVFRVEYESSGSTCGQIGRNTQKTMERDIVSDEAVEVYPEGFDDDLFAEIAVIEDSKEDVINLD